MSLRHAAALWQRNRFGAALRAQRWLVVPLAVGQLSVAVADGAFAGPYVVSIGDARG